VNRERRLRDRVLHCFGVQRSYTPRFLVEHPELQIQSILPILVGNEIARSTDGFRFLQIGAFDGVENDPIRELVETFDIAGVIVEPQRGAFDQLTENYRGFQGISMVNAAIGSANGEREFFTVGSESIQQASFDKAHLIKHNISEDEIVSVKVRCTTVETVLKQHAFDSVDLIQIDAEGFDAAILRSINLDDITPAIIRFERAHIPEQELEQCLSRLADHSYRFIVERRDITALRQGK